jgi:predicted HicB family RNase H-like nuclease
MRESRSLALSPDLHAALVELAAAEDITLSALISVLLNEALARRLRRRP